MQETWVQFLGQEDPLGKEVTAHPNILAWKMPWTEEPGGLQSMGHRESDATEQVHTYIDTTIYKIKDLLLCSTGNSARYSVMTYVGKESKKEYVCVCIHFSEFSSVQLLSHVRLFATP